MKRSDESTADWPMTTHTSTQQGVIPHLLCSAGGISFYAPVKVIPLVTRMAESILPHAVTSKDGNRYVYALPGGGEIEA